MLVDASVAAKLIVSEPDSDLAYRLTDNQCLIAPDLIFAELANILWKYHRRGVFAVFRPERFAAQGLFNKVVPSSTLYSAALSLAVELNHPAYDCFYLALALAEDDVVITADRRFHSVCAASSYAARVRLLG